MPSAGHPRMDACRLSARRRDAGDEGAGWVRRGRRGARDLILQKKADLSNRIIGRHGARSQSKAN